MLNFDKEHEQTLCGFLEQLSPREVVLDYAQLQGFLFAMACSPEPIKPAEWFDLIWLSDEPQFDSEDDAREFFRLVVGLSEHVAAAVEQRRYLPFGSTFTLAWIDELADWCDGFLVGHQYLEEVWQVALDTLADEALDEAVGMALGLANTFADSATNRQLTLAEDFGLADEQLPEAYMMLWGALDSYASVTELCAQGDQWAFDVEQLFLALEPVGRDDPCGCGSGRPFSQCCLH